MKINFAPPYIDENVINEVTDSLRSGWITTGPKVKALESEIQKFTNSNRVLAVNSWTSGAILTLTWFGLKPGDEVIIPAYTYCATALAVIHAGGTPVMVDVCDDFDICVEAIRKAITPRTKAIIPVDIAGMPCDYEAVMSLVKEEDIKNMFVAETDVQKQLGRILVLNDSAHSIGAFYNNHRVGINTDITIFSLHAVKNVTTAEGGAICINMPEPFDNDELYAQLRLMTLNCQTKDAFTKTKAGSWRYDIVGPGLKMNMADVNAAIGLAQIRQYPHMLSERRRVFERYTDALSKYDWVQLPPIEIDGRHTSYHVYALRIKNITEEQRDEIIRHISEKEVAVNVHFVPLPMLTYFHGLGFDIKDYPVSYDNYAREISLPVYPQLTNEMVDFVISTVVEAYNEVVGR